MDEPFRSGAVDFHKEALIKLAQRFVLENPGKRAVALVAEGDAYESGVWRDLEPDYRVIGVDGSIGFIVDRDQATRYLLGTAARNLEWLADEGNGPVRFMPVVHVGKPGIRAGGFQYFVREP